MTLKNLNPWGPTMKNQFKIFRTLVIGCFLILFLSPLVYAESGMKANLWLQKVDPYLYGPCGWCSERFILNENDDRKDFKQYNSSTQTGSYLIDLTGPAGTTVTLYGSQNYGLKHGYLILVKQDDKPIAIGDLENLPKRQWVEVSRSDTGPGLYRVWYHPSDRFEERIASIKWGQWWSELPPASAKE